MREKRFMNGAGRSTMPVSMVLILAIAVFSLGGCNRQNGAMRFASTSSAPVNNAPSNIAPAGTPAGPVVSYADIVSRVAPAVITIHSQLRARAPQQYPFMDDPFFRQFFGDRGQMQRPPAERNALGSGVIVSQDGYILTNHHVIDGAEQIKVDLNDNRTLDARVVGSDPPSDLAVLKVDASNLPVLSLGDSDRVRVGDVVLAVGNPLGVGQTVTMGIISAKGRQTGLSSGSFEDFLQTDAPINQGNSGGALVSTNSELVGINSQILSPSGGSIGIGFAIPSNMARTVLETLIKNGKVRRGQLGIRVGKVTSDVAKELGLKEAKGLVIGDVQSGSAADRAGLKKGDVITAFNGAEMNDPNVFRNQVASTAPDTEVTLTIQRGGSQQQVRARLGEFTPQVEPKEEDSPAHVRLWIKQLRWVDKYGTGSGSARLIVAISVR
jgi:Do/DeqQ family serine protease